MLSSDCYCIIGLFTVFLSWFVLKRLTTLYLKPPTDFLIGLGIKSKNKLYQLLLIGLFFFISFCSNLSIS